MKDCSRDQDCICRQARRPRARRWNCELKPQQPACACSAGGPGALNRMPDRRPSFRFRFRIGVRALAPFVPRRRPGCTAASGNCYFSFVFCCKKFFTNFFHPIFLILNAKFFYSSLSFDAKKFYPIFSCFECKSFLIIFFSNLFV